MDPKDITLKQIVSYIQLLGQRFEEVKYFHVLQDLNSYVDKRMEGEMKLR